MLAPRTSPRPTTDAGARLTHHWCDDCRSHGLLHELRPWSDHCPCGGTRTRTTAEAVAYAVALPFANALANVVAARAAESRPLTVTIDDAQAILGAGRSRIFQLLRRGQLKRARRIGRETRITSASIAALLEATASAPRRAPVAPAPPRAPTQAELDEQRRRLFGAKRRDTGRKGG